MTLKPNERGEVYLPFAFKQSVRELLSHGTPTRCAARLWDEGLKGKCKNLQSLTARMCAFGQPDALERPYFSEIDTLMDELQQFQPLFYLCDRHGFERPKRIDPLAELRAVEAALEDARHHEQQLIERRILLQGLLKDQPRSNVVGLTAYCSGPKLVVGEY